MLNELVGRSIQPIANVRAAHSRFVSMPPPSGPDIVFQCYIGSAVGVAKAIALGADLLELAHPARVGGKVYRPRKLVKPDPEWKQRQAELAARRRRRLGIALHYACFYAHVDCVRALLATGCTRQLDWRRAESGATPLILLCQNACRAACSINPHQAADTLPCVELLLEAGAALDPETTDAYVISHPVGSPSAEALCGRVIDKTESEDSASEDSESETNRLVARSGLTALDFAYLSGNSEIVRALEDAARLRYSVQTHHRFPRPARYAAARAVRLGYQIGSGALLPVWAGRVLPFLISRTSR
jgi:hypothetical protein